MRSGAAGPPLSAAGVEAHETAGLREDPATLSLIIILMLCRLLASSCCEFPGGHSLVQLTFPGSSRHPGVPQRVPRSLLTVSVKVPRRHTGSRSGAQKPLHELWSLPAVLCCGALWDWRKAAAVTQCFLRKKKKNYEDEGKLTASRGRQIILLWTIIHTSKNTFRGLISP